VGKEGNRLEDVATGEVTDPEEVLIDYGDDAWNHVVIPVARLMGVRRMARATGVSLSQVADLLHGRASPRPTTRTRFIEATAALAAVELGFDVTEGGSHPTGMLNAYLRVMT
jgi:hypothetical protein